MPYLCSDVFSSICCATALNKLSKRWLIGQACAFISFPLQSSIKSLNNVGIGSALLNDNLQCHTFCDICHVCILLSSQALELGEVMGEAESAAWHCRGLAFPCSELLGAWGACRDAAPPFRLCFNKFCHPATL